MRATVRKGFTLVEILIVVVILGILAAIVVPQFTNATQDAQGGNITTQLETINTQIELFRARTGATNADLAAIFDSTDPWDIFISGQDAGGGLMGGREIDGGYLKAAPRNPRLSGDDRWAVADGPAPDPVTGSGGGLPTHGWYYYTDPNGNFSIGAAYFNKETGQVEPDMYDP